MKRIKNLFNFTPTTKLFVFLNEIKRNKSILESEEHMISDGFRRYSFVFKEPVEMWFSLYCPQKRSEIRYSSIYRMTLNVISNDFIDCRLNFTDSSNEKQILILNNIYKLDYTIKP